jgi:hypothetical protein
MKQLVFADGGIRLDGGELPGIFVSLRVDGKVRYDEQNVDGISGKSKTPQGWEDHVIVASLVLLTDDAGDCYDKLAQLTPYFKKPDGKADPQIYSLTNRHTQTRGVRLVVFDRMESAESDQDDAILVTLGFTEHKPPIIRTETGAAKTPEAGDVGQTPSADTPKEEPSIKVDAS